MYTREPLAGPRSSSGAGAPGPETGHAVRPAASRPDGNLRDHAYRRLKAAILDARYPPGAKLDEIRVAAELGVSRTPVREAFSRLERDGLVEGSWRNGVRVVALADDAILELLDLQEVIEGLAARLAAPRLTTHELDELTALHRRFERLATREARLRAFFAYDVRFHRALIIGAGSRSLTELLSVVHDRLLMCRRRTMAIPGRLERSMGEHAAIVAALRARNGRLAEDRVRRHIRRLRREFLDTVEPTGRTG